MLKRIFLFTLFLSFVFGAEENFSNKIKPKKEEIILTYDLNNLYAKKKYTKKDIIQDIKVQVKKINKSLLKNDTLPYLFKVNFKNNILIYSFIIPEGFVKEKEYIIKKLMKKYKLSHKKATGFFVKTIALYINNQKSQNLCRTFGFKKIFKNGIKVRMVFYFEKIDPNKKIIETEISKCF